MTDKRRLSAGLQPFSFPSVLGRAFRNRIVGSVVATMFFMIVFLGVTNAWKLDIYKPLLYWGDALEMAAYMGRDYVFNDLQERFFAPFGVEHASSAHYVLNFLFQPNSTLFLIVYGMTRDTIGALNLYYLLTFPLAFLSAYWVYGRLKLPDPFCFGSATLYAMMPFHFQRGEGHLMESSYFLVPLLAYIVLLATKARPYFHAYVGGAWRWSGKAKRDWCLLGVAVFFSSLNEYHQLFFMMLLGLAALFASVRHRNYRILAGAAVLLAGAGLSTAVKMTAHKFFDEPGLGLSLIGAPISGYGEAELYGLKMIQMILPVSGHHLESFRTLTGLYNASHVVNENVTVALGLFGAVGVVYLISRGIYAIIAKRQSTRILDICSLITVCCVVIATVGGVASFIATAGRILFGPESLLTQVRCYNRIIVFIAFFSYYACSVLLARLALRFAAYDRRSLPGKAVVTIIWLPIFAFALWDQVPFQLVNSSDMTARYASDKHFFSRVEAELAPRSLIFQYPLNIHHADVNESAHISYNYADGIRPYLNSQTLRFTYGGDKGSAQVKWLEETSSLPLERMIRRLCEYGFAGIVVHRQLFKAPEEAAAFEARLSAVLGSLLQESADKDFSFTPLNEYCARKQISKLDLAAQRIRLSGDSKPNIPLGPRYEATLAEGIDFRTPGYPNFLAGVSGILEREPSGRWGVGQRTTFVFKEKLPERFKLVLVADTLWPNQNKPIMVEVGSVVRELVIGAPGQTYTLNFEGHGDQTAIEFVVPRPVVPKEAGINSDTRPLSIWFISMKIEDL